MPIIFFPGSKEQIVTRGERIGWTKKLLLFIGFPVDFQAMMSDDIYTVTKHHPPILQLTDNEARKRMAEAEARRAREAEEAAKQGQRQKNKFFIPGKR